MKSIIVDQIASVTQACGLSHPECVACAAPGKTMNASTEVVSKLTFQEELQQQRWDDHRFYHQSRVNQILHLFSASCFLVSYALIPFNPIAAALLGWVVAMWSRQIGHFFFEPKGFDHINNVTFEHKEAVKVGYNLQRKVILFVVWLSVPAAFVEQSDVLGSVFVVRRPFILRSSRHRVAGARFCRLASSDILALRHSERSDGRRSGSPRF